MQLDSRSSVVQHNNYEAARYEVPREVVEATPAPPARREDVVTPDEKPFTAPDGRGSRPENAARADAAAEKAVARTAQAAGSAAVKPTTAEPKPQQVAKQEPKQETSRAPVPAAPKEPAAREPDRSPEPARSRPPQDASAAPSPRDGAPTVPYEPARRRPAPGNAPVPQPSQAAAARPPADQGPRAAKTADAAAATARRSAEAQQRPKAPPAAGGGGTGRPPTGPGPRLTPGPEPPERPSGNKPGGSGRPEGGGRPGDRPPGGERKEVVVGHQHSDRVLGATVRDGRPPERVKMDSDDAAMVDGAAEILRRRVNNRVPPGAPPPFNTIPGNLPGAAVVVAHLGRGETVTGLVAAAEIVLGAKREHSRGRAAAVAAGRAGSRVLPAVVGGDSKAAVELRAVANSVVQNMYGREHTRRHGPTAAPLLYARAVYLAGKEVQAAGEALQADPDAPGKRQALTGQLVVAAGVLESFDAAVVNSSSATKSVESGDTGSLPKEVTQLQRNYHDAKNYGQYDTLSQAMERAGSLAAEYAAFVDARIENDAAFKDQQRVTEYREGHSRKARPGIEQQASAAYAANLAQPPEVLAGKAEEAVDSRSYGVALDAVMALIGHHNAGNDDAREALGRLWPAISPQLLTYAFENRELIAKGVGVTPAIVLFAQLQPEMFDDPAAGAKLEAVHQAAVDAACSYFGMDRWSPFKVNPEDKPTAMVRTASTWNNRNIPEFIRAAYTRALCNQGLADRRVQTPAARVAAREAHDAFLRAAQAVHMTGGDDALLKSRSIPETLRAEYQRALESIARNRQEGKAARPGVFQAMGNLANRMTGRRKK